MDNNPTKPETGDPATLDDVKDKGIFEQADLVEAPTASHWDELNRLIKSITTIKLEISEYTLDPSIGPLRIEPLLAVLRETLFKIQDLQQKTLCLSQFFVFSEIEIKDVDCSDVELAKYKTFLQTVGEFGERVSLTDYRIARESQAAVLREYRLEFTVAQMVQLRVSLKQATLKMGDNLHGPFFDLAYKRVNNIETGEVDVNSVLDDILRVSKYFNAKPCNDTAEKANLTIHDFKSILLLTRGVIVGWMNFDWAEIKRLGNVFGGKTPICSIEQILERIKSTDDLTLLVQLHKDVIRLPVLENIKNNVEKVNSLQTFMDSLDSLINSLP